MSEEAMPSIDNLGDGIDDVSHAKVVNAYGRTQLVRVVDQVQDTSRVPSSVTAPRVTTTISLGVDLIERDIRFGNLLVGYLVKQRPLKLCTPRVVPYFVLP
jgi:hypothetical protein|tara:strand:- start:8064 stop:8366 length:303 start_codon:yes stop_codon:yes gene_type:complete